MNLMLFANLTFLMLLTGNIGRDKGSHTSQSSVASQNNPGQFISSNGVDGGLRTKANCVFTAGPSPGESFPPSWWSVHLTSLHVILSVTVYARFTTTGKF